MDISATYCADIFSQIDPWRASLARKKKKQAKKKIADFQQQLETNRVGMGKGLRRKVASWGWGRRARLLIALGLILFFVDQALFNLSVFGALLSVSPASWIISWWNVPSVFRGPRHFDVAVSDQDGIALLSKARQVRHARIERRKSARIAIATPFVGRQVSQLIRNLKRLAALPGGGAVEAIDLLLFYHRSQRHYEEHVSHEQRQLVQRTCAGAMGGRACQVVFQDLTEPEDVYTVFNSAGPVNQMLGIVIVLHQAGYEGFFLQEPDTWPARAGWGDALLHMLLGPEKEGWWMRGTVWRNWRPTLEHINGNALYRLQDNGFYVFLYHALLSPRLRIECFDFAINELRLRISRSWADYQWLLHKFSYTPFLLNIHGTDVCLSPSEIVQTYPGTYFVHSRMIRGETC